MKKAILNKKNNLLKKISEKKYYSYLEFVREIYLSDYDLKIIMARKCSNFYLALLDIALEEENSLLEEEYYEKFNGKKGPTVISNRALCYYISEIKKGDYKKILIIDDLVIHGNTISTLYKKLKEYNPSVDISVLAYTEGSDSFVKEYEKIEKRKKVLNSINENEWMEISNDIVNILHELGQPYISYVPSFILRMESEAGKKIKEKYGNELEEAKGNNGIFRIELGDFKSDSVYLSKSLRVYINDSLGQYILVPMVLMRMIEEDTLKMCMKHMARFIKKQYFENLEKNKMENGSLRMMVLTYALSTLWGICKIQECFGIDFNEINNDDPRTRREEKLNFGELVLEYTKISECHKDGLVNKCLDTIAEECKNVNKISQEAKDTVFNSIPYKELEVKINNLLKEVKGSVYNSWEMGTLEESKHQFVIEKILYEISKKDERKNRKIVGIPVEILIQAFQYEDVFGKILRAIDYGKGAIVVEEAVFEEKKYYFSVLFSGELSISYIDIRYLPFLYGECYIALLKEIGKINEDNINNIRESFYKELKDYWITKKMCYLEEDIEAIKKRKYDLKFYNIIKSRVNSFCIEDEFLKFCIGTIQNWISMGSRNG